MCSFEVRRSRGDGAEYWEGALRAPRTCHGIGCGDAILRLPSGSESRISINQITRARVHRVFQGHRVGASSNTTVSQNAVSQWLLTYEQGFARHKREKLSETRVPADFRDAEGTKVPEFHESPSPC
jgi:hypothetical protein